MNLIKQHNYKQRPRNFADFLSCELDGFLAGEVI